MGVVGRIQNLLIIFTKSLVVDVWQDSEYASGTIIWGLVRCCQYFSVYLSDLDTFFSQVLNWFEKMTEKEMKWRNQTNQKILNLILMELEMTKSSCFWKYGWNTFSCIIYGLRLYSFYYFSYILIEIRFFYMQRFFSAQPQYCITFSWIQLKLLLRCCLIHNSIIILRHFLYLLYLCPCVDFGLLYFLFMWSVFHLYLHFQYD